jgi:hypothetical protein
LLAILLTVAAVWLLRVWILRTVAWGLIVNEDCPIADYVWIADGDHCGDRCFDRAAQLYRKRPSMRIILVAQYRQRIVQIGVQPPPEAIGRRELASRGVPSAAVIVIPGRARNAWEEVQLLTSWLASQSGAEVLLLCDQFGSRLQRHIVDSVMDANGAKHIHIDPLPNRRFDEHDWWRKRDGVKHLGLSFLELLYAWYRGAPGEAAETWTPADYERTLRQKLKKAQP